MAVKAGIKTTEFWLTMITNLITIVGSLKGVLDPQVSAIILAAANGVYGVIRAMAKQGQV